MPLDWQSLDQDDWHAPEGWEWTIDDELAHHLWDQTAKTAEVGWGLEPPMLLEFLMGFFDGRSMSDSLNNWYMTRHPDKTYMEETTWHKPPSKMQYGQGREETTEILCWEERNPHPFRVKLHGQQYTVNGAMFTYDFQQWQGEEVTGFCRIPCPSDLLEVVRERITDLPFEETQYQSRQYRAQFSEGPAPTGTFAHPHFAPVGNPDKEAFKELFTRAHTLMKRGVRMEG